MRKKQWPALTVLMDPMVCSTTLPASEYAACPRLDSFAIIHDMTAPAMAMGGKLESMTRERSHPLANAMMKPPKKVDNSCTNFPTWIQITCGGTLGKTADSGQKERLLCLTWRNEQYKLMKQNYL